VLFRIAIAFEVACGIVILFFSAYISITTPPFIVEQFSYQESHVTGKYVLYLEQHPYEAGMLRVRAEDKDTKAPVALDDVIVALSNPAKGIADNLIKTE